MRKREQPLIYPGLGGRKTWFCNKVLGTEEHRLSQAQVQWVPVTHELGHTGQVRLSHSEPHFSQQWWAELVGERKVCILPIYSASNWEKRCM